MVSYNPLSTIVFKIRVANDYKLNVMLWQNLSSALVIDFPLLTTTNSTNSLTFIKEWDSFCMLLFAILYDKTLFFVIRIDRQSLSRIAN